MFNDYTSPGDVSEPRAWSHSVIITTWSPLSLNCIVDISSSPQRKRWQTPVWLHAPSTELLHKNLLFFTYEITLKYIKNTCCFTQTWQEKTSIELIKLYSLSLSSSSCSLKVSWFGDLVNHFLFILSFSHLSSVFHLLFKSRILLVAFLRLSFCIFGLRIMLLKLSFVS